MGLIIQINTLGTEQIGIGNALTQADANGEFASLTKTYALDNSVLLGLVAFDPTSSTSLNVKLDTLILDGVKTKRCS